MPLMVGNSPKLPQCSPSCGSNSTRHTRSYFNHVRECPKSSSWGWTVLREAMQHDPRPQLPSPGPLCGHICSAHVAARGWHGSHVLWSSYQQGINHMQLKPYTVEELSWQTECFRETNTVNRQDPGEKLPRVSCRQVQAYT